jgi:hypothetical protein
MNLQVEIPLSSLDIERNHTVRNDDIDDPNNLNNANNQDNQNNQAKCPCGCICVPACFAHCYPQFINSFGVVAYSMKLFFSLILDVLILVSWIVSPFSFPALVVFIFLEIKKLDRTIQMYPTITAIAYSIVAFDLLIYILYLIIICHQINVCISKKINKHIPTSYRKKICNIYYLIFFISAPIVILSLVLILSCAMIFQSLFYIAIISLCAPFTLFIIWMHEERSYKFFLRLY